MNNRIPASTAMTDAEGGGCVHHGGLIRFVSLVLSHPHSKWHFGFLRLTGLIARNGLS